MMDNSTSKDDLDFAIDIQPLTNSDTPFWPNVAFLDKLSGLWSLLCNVSVDAALDGKGGVLKFSERCLFFGKIYTERTHIEYLKPSTDSVSVDSAQGPDEGQSDAGNAGWEKMVPAETRGTKTREFVGFVYLLTPPNAEAEAACECSVGIMLVPSARRKGIGSYALHHALKLAFDTLAFHRVSAHVLGPSSATDLIHIPDIISDISGEGKKEMASNVESSVGMSERAMKFFVGLGFKVEGVRYRGVRSMLSSSNGVGEGEWRDATSLAMLDTEWFYMQGRVEARAKRPVTDTSVSTSSCSGISTITEKPSGKKYVRRSRWEEMLTRHQREREALAVTEGRLKRSASTETIKAEAGTGAPEPRGSFEVEDTPATPAPGGRLYSTVSRPIPSTMALSLYRDKGKKRAYSETDEESVTETEVDSDVMDFVSGRSTKPRMTLALDVMDAHEKVETYLEQVNSEDFTPGPPPSDIGDNASDLDSGSDFDNSAWVSHGNSGIGTSSLPGQTRHSPEGDSEMEDIESEAGSSSNFTDTQVSSQSEWDIASATSSPPHSVMSASSSSWTGASASE